MALTQVLIKLPPELKNKVKLLANKEGKNFSMIVRELLENYIKQRDIESHIDNIWEKIGNELKQIEPEKIDELIHKIRKEKRC